MPGNHSLSVVLNGAVKVRGNLAQTGGDLGRPKKLYRMNAVLLFQMPADVIHRAVTVQQIQLGMASGLHFRDGAIT